ncbi:MAG: DNA-3-methyladenine glycosylase 2 family protein [Actinomycetota bacterium]
MPAPLRAHRHIGSIDLAASLRWPAILPHDPSVELTATTFRRATWTPDGPAEIHLQWAEGSVAAAGWGDGAAWLLDRLDGLVGLEDDVSTFAPIEPRLDRLWRAHRHQRMTATGTLWHDIAGLILQQRVRFVDAAASWRRMLQAWGDPGPGPSELLLPPDPAQLAQRSYTELHQFGIERSRAQILVNTARSVPRLVGRVDEPWADFAPRLASLRGIGPWTRAGVESLTFGSADAVLVGDIGAPTSVAWFFARERRADDTRMLELLEPYRPHRFRVLQLILSSGDGPPRRHHRLARNPIERR